MLLRNQVCSRFFFIRYVIIYNVVMTDDPYFTQKKETLRISDGKRRTMIFVGKRRHHSTEDMSTTLSMNENLRRLQEKWWTSFAQENAIEQKMGLKFFRNRPCDACNTPGHVFLQQRKFSCNGECGFPISKLILLERIQMCVLHHIVVKTSWNCFTIYSNAIV